MSDRVSNAEVEDVLSSIRRLVSEDHRGGKARAKPVPPEASEDEGPVTGRLVLTPALRITPVPADEAAKADTDEVSAEDASSAPKSDMSIDSLVTDDVPFDPFTHRLDTEADDALASDDLHLATHPNVADEAFEHDDAGPAVEEIATQSIEAEQTAANDGFADVVPETTSDVSTASADVDLDVTTDDVEEVSEGTAPDSAQSGDDTPEDATTTPDIKAAALGAKIAALETAIGKISDTWEPDDAGESDYAGTQPDVMDWEDDKPEPETTPFARPMLAPVMQMPKDPKPETADDDEVDAAEATPVSQPFMSKRSNPSKPLTDVVEAPEVEEEDQTVTAAPEPVSETPVHNAHPAEDPIATARVSEDDQLIDEEALRDLVSDIVRAELQGALGERITRNVRKLVRREIHRALIAQELE